MSDDKKDKIIYGLIVAVVILLANFIYTNDVGGVFNDKDEKLNLIDQTKLEENKIDDSLDVEDESMDRSIKKVHISGEINNPGVYEIRDEQRLEDLIKEAGGLTNEADDRNLNLSQRLEDQMKIYIPNINEENLLENTDRNQEALPVGNTASSLVNINTANKDDLMSLPNIGDKRADAIIEYRKTQKFEKIEDMPLVVVKKSGRKELFDRSKVMKGLVKACEKRPISLDRLEALSLEIEKDLKNEGREVHSAQIGQAIMNRLIELDQVAYVRFASVYKDFNDVETFIREIENLPNRHA